MVYMFYKKLCVSIARGHDSAGGMVVLVEIVEPGPACLPVKSLRSGRIFCCLENKEKSE